MSDRQKWSISDVKTVEGETMIVGGESYEFGLIATVTDENDAKQIITDREIREALVKALQDMVFTAEDDARWTTRADRIFILKQAQDALSVCSQQLGGRSDV